MDGEPSHWVGRDLWRIFWRGIERDRALCIGLDDGRYIDATQCLETGNLFQRQFRGGDFLFVLRESDLVRCTRDGGRCVDRRKLGRTSGRPRPARDLALDDRDHWRGRCHHLSGARLVNVRRAKKLQIRFPRGLKEVESIRGLKLFIMCLSSAYDELRMN